MDLADPPAELGLVEGPGQDLDLEALSRSIVGSCSIANGISCSDYEDMSAEKPKEMCTKYGGKWSTTACPAAKRVGTCIQKQTPRGRILTHSYPPAPAASARKACGNTPGGTFQP